MKILEKISSWTYKVSIGWVTLASVIIFVFFTSFILPDQAAGADSINEEVGSPDLSFFYTPDNLYEMAKAYGEQGRAAYIHARFTFDLIWPLVYTLFLSTAISWLFRRVNLSNSRWRWANLVPITGMIFDFAENISTSFVMYRYPTTSNIMATLAPFFTAIKWVMVVSSFIVLLIGITAFIMQTIKNFLGKKP